MANFFKGTEKRPFAYPTIIEERKGSGIYWPIFIGIGLVVVGGIFFFFILR